MGVQACMYPSYVIVACMHSGNSGCIGPVSVICWKKHELFDQGIFIVIASILGKFHKHIVQVKQLYYNLNRSN